MQWSLGKTSQRNGCYWDPTKIPFTSWCTQALAAVNAGWWQFIAPLFSGGLPLSKGELPSWYILHISTNLGQSLTGCKQKAILLASWWNTLRYNLCSKFPPRDQMETSLQLITYSCWNHFAPAFPCFPYSPSPVNTPSIIPLYRNSLRCSFSIAFFVVQQTNLSVKVYVSFQSDIKFSYRDGNIFLPPTFSPSPHTKGKNAYSAFKVIHFFIYAWSSVPHSVSLLNVHLVLICLFGPGLCI